MSSHHVVREKQEPALLILGMDTFSDELLGQLLEWSPTVVANELMAEKLNSEGIKVDFILTDNQPDIIQSDAKQIPLGGNTDVGKGMKFLTQHQYPSVNIVTDKLNLAHYESYVEQINLVIFSNTQKIYPVHTGFNKWKLANELITVISRHSAIQTTGLKQIDTDIYQTVADGIFTLQFNEPFLFISESL